MVFSFVLSGSSISLFIMSFPIVLGEFAVSVTVLSVALNTVAVSDTLFNPTVSGSLFVGLSESPIRSLYVDFAWIRFDLLVGLVAFLWRLCLDLLSAVCLVLLSSLSLSLLSLLLLLEVNSIC